MPSFSLTIAASLALVSLFNGVASFPSGNATISSWAPNQSNISLKNMFTSINPPNTARGFLAASLSTSSPNYYYSWTRDSALSYRVLVNQLRSGANSTIDGYLQDYVAFSQNSQSVNTVCNCLGEPKFNPDGSSFSGPWGRPQNDGPAERASTLILYAGSSSNTDLKTIIYKDLDYVTTVWDNQNFDLWEEVNGRHFFTYMVMRRGLLDGVDYATKNGDTDKASSYKAVVANIESRINSFWQSDHITVTIDQASGVSKPSGLDASVLIASNVGSRADGFFTPGSDKVLATAVKIEAAFANLYNINKNKADYLGTAIGRYPEDVYNGTGTSTGNPWFICTNAFAELYYRAIKEWTDAGSVKVTDISQPFFAKFDSSATSGTTYTAGSSEFTSLVNNIANAADQFLSTVHYHQHANGSLSEQYNRDTGYSQGAYDLTWSGASMVTALNAKAGNPDL
ncbi:glucoamylase [Halteromyces radiatus]|uniref:glucoamylase n=1 Tax=Halteromyces radiatus TaxID=101107 RepID=UPI0022203FA5|nr:glucoamylase [Halteromyces radiatus]KAI8086021.1 glucoamylase [Halteromyces radiatus]